MKYVFLTEPNSQGISEVFHTTMLPEDLVPKDLFDRWKRLIENSPVKAMVVTGKRNIAPGSTWDEESQEFTLAAGIPEDATVPDRNVTYVFLIDNAVAAIIQGQKNSLVTAKYEAAFAGPVGVIGLEDEDLVDIGYTYNGSAFTAPVEN
jgi:hypothetical protein